MSYGDVLRRWIGRAALAAIAAVALSPVRAPASPLEIFNPDWSITLTDFGYSDLLFDQRPGFVGREYLSGEWAAAFSYKVGPTPTAPTWLEPHFLAPNWLTNSNFTVVSPIAGTGVFNASGFEKFSSIVTNGDLGVGMVYEFEDTLVGTPQGNMAASAGGPGASVMSSRYVLRQTYTLLNMSGDLITDLQAFQFLHGLHSTKAVFDSRVYPGPLAGYHFDVTLQGLSSDGQFLHDDTIAMHSAVAPSAWEVGRYGIEGIDSHVVGKPSVGVHLSIEANALSGLDFFGGATPPLWVSGAMRWDLPHLAPGEHFTYDVLLSLSTVTVPELGGASLLASLLAPTALAVGVRRLRARRRAA